MAYGTVNADVIQSSVSGVSLGAGNATVFKNRIINGDMRIDQRNAGASVSISTGTANYTVDRWSASASGGGVFTAQQTTTVPEGFTNSFGLTVTTVDSSIATNDYYIIEQQIEGLNCTDLGFGTANAKTVTVSFWVRSSLTGLAGGRLCNSATNRSYVFTYTINSANTWEYKTATIAGDTSGTWLTSNGRGIGVLFNLTSGSGLTTSTIGSWVNGNYHGPSSQTVNFIGTNGATFYITGVQLEVGSSATGFEYRDYGRELAMCQRYYQLIQSATGAANTSTNCVFTIQPFTVMRAGPTVGQNGVLYISDFANADVVQSSTNTTTYTSFNDMIIMGLGNFTGISVLRPYFLRGINTNSITLSAEL